MIRNGSKSPLRRSDLYSVAFGLAAVAAWGFHAYTTNEGYAAQVGAPPLLRVIADRVITATFAPGSGTIAKLTPLAYNTSLNKWVVWASAGNQVDTLTYTGTVSGATFTLTVNGHVTTAIAYNASNATILAALIATGVVDTGDVVLTGGPIDNTHPLIFSWAGKFTNKPVTFTITSSVTGGGTATLANTTAGAVNDTWIVRGFSNDDIVLDAANDQVGPIILEGQMSFLDIVLPAGQTSNNLKAALQSQARDHGLIIRDLVQIR